jgi:aspartyl-tRNA(Asn)/glutamyl-tRNA(Gln) amidotransferase subunit A
LSWSDLPFSMARSLICTLQDGVRSHNVRCRDNASRTSEIVEKGHTSEAPRDVISLHDVWSRRSFVKAGLSYGGILLLSSHLTKEAVAIQHTSAAKEPHTDLTTLSVGEAADLVRRKAISPVELTRACLQQIERLNPVLNAFITVTAEQALAEAREAEAEVRRGRWRGPLHGIPIGLKDNIDTAGVRTTLASAVFKDRVPSADAEVVRRLKAAGAVLLGKQNLHEVAFGTTAAVSHFGPVRNPWNHDRISGGSSGGSAAAVAAGLCFGAVGTDAGGSIRVPSAYCGIVGFKPTYGLVGMRGGGEAGWWSMNHVGPICRSVADAALLLSTIAGYDPRDSTSIDVPIPNYTAALRANVSALRLGVPRAVFYDQLDPEIEAAISTALGVLRRLTSGLRDVSVPPISNTLAPTIVLAENYAFHAAYFAKTPQFYDAAIRRNLQRGSEVTTAAYIQSRRELDEARRAIGAIFSTVDVLVTPTTAMPPPAIEEVLRLGIDLELIRNTAPFNTYGLPTISLPCGFTRSGLPIGMQISGPRFGESKVLALAHAFEHETDWHTRRPYF